jgi:hypothetical protein
VEKSVLMLTTGQLCATSNTQPVITKRHNMRLEGVLALVVLGFASIIPLATAQSCRWDGTAPFCSGSCGANENELTRLDSIPNFWAPPFVQVIPPFGSSCLTGSKALCCSGRGPRCRWDGTAPFCSGSCRGDEVQAPPPDGSYKGASCWTGDKVYCCNKIGSSGQPLVAADCSSGPGTCAPGFVWREANPSDHVCVIPQVRDEARSDNAQAAGRRSPTGGPSGPDTCISGFVWREAFSGDHVCVTPQTRSQAAQDNGWSKVRNACPSPTGPEPPEPPSGTFSNHTPEGVLSHKRALYVLSLDDPLVAPAGAAIDVQLAFQDCQSRPDGCPVTPDLEQWAYDPSTHRLYHAASGKCVNISGARQDAGSPIILYPCSGAANEKWTVFERSGSPIWSFKSDLTGMCLHANPGRSSNRLLNSVATLVQMPCDGSDAQRFNNVDSRWSERNGPH